MKLTEATMEDIPLISRIHATSWKTAYRGMIPQAYLDTLPETYWVEAFATWFGSGKLRGLIAWEGETPVGCISFGQPVSVPDAALKQLSAGCGEVRALYLLPEYMGKGYGARLLHAAEIALRMQGYENCCLYTLEENTKARAFYEKHGYAMNCVTEAYEIAGKHITDIRYCKSLACPCPRRCKRHGDCTACQEAHRTRKYPCYCERTR